MTTWQDWQRRVDTKNAGFNRCCGPFRKFLPQMSGDMWLMSGGCTVNISWPFKKSMNMGVWCFLIHENNTPQLLSLNDEEFENVLQLFSHSHSPLFFVRLLSVASRRLPDIDWPNNYQELVLEKCTETQVGLACYQRCLSDILLKALAGPVDAVRGWQFCWSRIRNVLQRSLKEYIWRHCVWPSCCCGCSRYCFWPCFICSTLQSFQLRKKECPELGSHFQMTIQVLPSPSRTCRRSWLKSRLLGMLEVTPGGKSGCGRQVMKELPPKERHTRAATCGGSLCTCTRVWVCNSTLHTWSHWHTLTFPGNEAVLLNWCPKT